MVTGGEEVTSTEDLREQVARSFVRLWWSEGTNETLDGFVGDLFVTVSDTNADGEPLSKFVDSFVTDTLLPLFATRERAAAEKANQRLRDQVEYTIRLQRKLESLGYEAFGEFKRAQLEGEEA